MRTVWPHSHPRVTSSFRQEQEKKQSGKKNKQTNWRFVWKTSTGAQPVVGALCWTTVVSHMGQIINLWKPESQTTAAVELIDQFDQLFTGRCQRSNWTRTSTFSASGIEPLLHLNDQSSWKEDLTRAEVWGNNRKWRRFIEALWRTSGLRDTERVHLLLSSLFSRVQFSWVQLCCDRLILCLYSWSHVSHIYYNNRNL